MLLKEMSIYLERECMKVSIKVMISWKPFAHRTRVLSLGGGVIVNGVIFPCLMVFNNLPLFVSQLKSEMIKRVEQVSLLLNKTIKTVYVFFK